MLAAAPVHPAVPASDLERATRFYRDTLVAEWGGLRGAWFKDSEGNILGVTQMRTR